MVGFDHSRQRSTHLAYGTPPRRREECLYANKSQAEKVSTKILTLSRVDAVGRRDST